MQRNALYLKPRTVLMIDTIEPADRDVDVTMLYQTAHLEDITASEDCSSIAKEGTTLYFKHLSPTNREVKAVETPHYLYTLQRDKPLKREGMLTVTAHTDGNPLIMANILTTTAGNGFDISSEEGAGYVSGTVDGILFAYSTRPGSIYEVNGIATDALAMTGSLTQLFAAMCTTLSVEDRLLLASENPVTCEIGHGRVKYYTCSDTIAAIGAGKKPSSVTLNGQAVKYIWDSEKSAIVVTLPKGEGVVEVK